ncbi:MAG: peptidoglycan recognition protein family protein [Planctomycetes bacterium]|nr:peptidoglycan recognition protein family protein [Planctomycetota bacterium]
MNPKILLLLVLIAFAGACLTPPQPKSSGRGDSEESGAKVQFPSPVRLKDTRGADFKLFANDSEFVSVVGRRTSGLGPPNPDAGLNPYEFETLAQLRNVYDTLTIHHSAGPGDEDVRQIQRFHMDTRGWADVGYHFLIASDGTTYEGRPVGFQGAHVENNNRGNLGICVQGNFAFAERVPEAQLASLWQLARALNLMLRFEHVRGHKEFKDTECPSELLMDEVEAMRAEFHLPD